MKSWSLTGQGSIISWCKLGEQMERKETLSLRAVALNQGISMPCTGNQPLDMSDNQSAWFIESGEVDVFLIEEKEGVLQAAPRHMLHFCSGRLIIGVAPNDDDTRLRLIAKGDQHTVLRKLCLDDLSAVYVADLAGQTDRWIENIGTMLSRFSSDTRMTVTERLAESSSTQSIDAGIVAARQGVQWVSGIGPGSASYLGMLDPDEISHDHAGTTDLLPLTRESWIQVLKPLQISAQGTQSVIHGGLLTKALSKFHALALSIERDNRRLTIADQVNLARERILNRQTDEDVARHGLFNLHGISGKPEARTDRAILFEVLGLVGQHEGIEFKNPVRNPAQEDHRKVDALLFEILDASDVRSRRVNLRSTGKWWNSSCGAMLAFSMDDQRPVALLPNILGRYFAIDSKTGKKKRVNADVAQSLQKEAWYFYPPLTSEARSVRDVLALAFRGSMTGFIRFLLSGAIVGLLMLFPAILLGFVADEVIPHGKFDQLPVLGAVLVAVAFLAATLQLYHGMSSTRVEAYAAARAEAALFCRVLCLPSHFLQKFTAGELATQCSSFQLLRDAMQNLVANGALSFLFLFVSLCLGFVYDATLGIIAIVVGLLSVAVMIVLGMRQIGPYMDVTHSLQELVGQVFQLINGISILNLEGAQGSGFAVWAKAYGKQHRAEFRHSRIESHVQAFGAAILPIGFACLLMATVICSPENLKVGEFLVVIAIFLAFLNAVRKLGYSFHTVAEVLVAIRQIRPLVEQKPDAVREGESVDSLSGHVRIDHVSFRYSPDTPLVLDNLSMHVRPNEFVAITGESGSGKSTLLKILLGMEMPVSGAVYYDGNDLKQLNPRQVRRRIGVVPQSIQLFPEDIWDNIAGGQENIDSKSVWEAAQHASIKDEIMSMPMKMLTSVGVSGGTASGGESQRIMLARALISKPDILMLDEATTWLDNDKQARIMEDLATLNKTRIVIAHRLSTLRYADRIYVLQQGKVVEEGSFDDLMALQGVFFNLARRQLTGSAE